MYWVFIIILLHCCALLTSCFTMRIDGLVQSNYVLNLMEVQFLVNTNVIQVTSGILSSTSVVEPVPNGPVNACFDGNLNTYCSSAYPSVSSPWMTMSIQQPFDTILGKHVIDIIYTFMINLSLYLHMQYIYSYM